MMKQHSLIYMAVVSLFLLVSCNKADPDAAKVKMNKEIMKGIMDAVAANNVDALDKLIDANYIEHSPDPMMKGTGLPALKEGIRAWHMMYPDLKMTVNFMVAEGDIVSAHYSWSGTNTGSVEGFPATGKKVNVDGVDIARFKDGIGVEHWGYFDFPKMMEQLGMMPPPSEAGGEMKK